MGRRTPRQTPDTAQIVHDRESFLGALRGRSNVPIPVGRDANSLARARAGGASASAIRAYQDVFTLTGVADETVELTYLPLTYSEHVYLNGVYQREGGDYDWTRESGTRTVTVDGDMDARAGDILIVEYLYYAGTPATPAEGVADASYVAVGTRDFDLTTVTPGTPAGAQAGDLFVLQITAAADTDAGATFGGLSGWTLQGTVTSTNADQLNYATVAVYTRTYDSGSYSAPNITASGLNGGFGAAVHAWRGASVNTVATWGSSSTSPFNTTGITTGVPGSIVVACAGVSDDLSIVNWVAAGLESVTTVFSQDSGVENVGLGMAYGVRATAGATGTITFESNAEAASAVTLEIV